MSAQGLSVLPTELVVLILSLTSNPRDLFAIIRSSKFLYLVLNTSRIKILAAVVRNAFESTLYDAVTACEASQICRIWAADPTHPIYDHQERFITEYVNLYDTRVIDLRDETLLFSLSKLW
jgi:hypothetical protein